MNAAHLIFFFFNYGDSPPPVVDEIDTYVDDREIKRRDREYRERNKRIRDDLLLAIDGPQAEEVTAAVSAYVEGPVAAPLRIDYGELSRRFDVLALIERAAAAKRAADDEDEQLLLSV